MILITPEQEDAIGRNNGRSPRRVLQCVQRESARPPAAHTSTQQNRSFPKPGKPSGYDDSAVLYADLRLAAGQPADLHGTQMVKADRNAAVSKTAGQQKTNSRLRPAVRRYMGSAQSFDLISVSFAARKVFFVVLALDIPVSHSSAKSPTAVCSITQSTKSLRLRAAK